MRKYLIIGALFLAIVAPLALAFIYRGNKVTPKSVTLNYWIVEDDPTDYAAVVQAYQAVHPYVKFNFVKVKLEDYEKNLINALARDAGPDIFSLPNTWLKKYQDIILPLPNQTRVAWYETKKNIIGQSVNVKYATSASINLAELSSNYIDVVQKDVVLTDSSGLAKIYGLPYSVDTLGLYYNEDLLNNAHLPAPAKTWQELVIQCSKLTLLDQQNNILQSCIALGLSSNIKNYFDILSLIMMQNGTQMLTADGKKVSFSQGVEAGDLGVRALDFYTGFTDLNKETYSWNSKQPESLDAFISGKSAYYLGYLSEKELIQAGAPGLNLGITEIFHINIDGTDRVLNPAGNPVQINYGGYWVETVAKKTKAPNEAWDFIQVLAREKRNITYVATTGKISPLKSVLQEQIKNPDLQVWANQALTAQSWYKGRDASLAKDYFKEMIDSVALEEADLGQAINLAAQKIEKTL
ncbi:MAG: extracellular solute-binding protein [Patescibacteria group bacterium]